MSKSAKICVFQEFHSQSFGMDPSFSTVFHQKFSTCICSSVCYAAIWARMSSSLVRTPCIQSWLHLFRCHEQYCLFQGYTLNLLGIYSDTCSRGTNLCMCHVQFSFMTKKGFFFSVSLYIAVLNKRISTNNNFN